MHQSKKRLSKQGPKFLGMMERLLTPKEIAAKQSGCGGDQDSNLTLLSLKRKKNHATHIINKARKAFYSDFIDSNRKDQGKLLRSMKKLLAPSQRLLFPDYDDHQSLANDIGEFFCRKIHNIRTTLDSSVITQEEKATLPEDPVVGDEKKLQDFRQLSYEEVRSLVQKPTKKTCNLDPMPTSMVVACLEELLPVITRILNSSLALGHFPPKWKDALVDPRLKTRKDTSFPNLRPVSNLQYISKLTERAVYDQTHSHMSRYELYPLLQSAYRAGHSTETALLKVQNDILLNMDRKRITLLVLLDLSTAFDTVDHRVLVRRLESSFGITVTALSWFSSSLSQRSQRICYEGCTSKTFDLHHGVPQGSCLGPLRFTVYASKLFEVIESHLPDVHAYADDTQLYLSFQADSEADQAEAVSAMERCIASISNWMKLNKV